ncbi:polysaccharide biosynthesis tyrosine autokinase [Myceligenerans crystallogenes]|uniref:non-specific protein-tyrosine kinase n=1 Tax=Myceligenerans crystallogenes TaxID=316335 RepID=A0ABP4ZJE6_9MICO
MGLAEYLGVLRKYWMTITATTVLAVVLAVLATVLATPRYQASSQVFVSVRGGEDSVNAMVAGRNFSAEQVTSYTEIVTSPRVLEPVIEDLGLADTPMSLASRVRAERPKNTVLINIVASDASPSVAAAVANGIAASLAKVVPDLETEVGSDRSPVEISTIREAAIPGAPVSPQPALNVVLGLLAGLVLGVGIAVVRDLLDTRIRTAADVEAITGSSVIGSIPFEEHTRSQPLIVSESPQSPRAEAFRRLRTNLQFLEVGSSSRCFVVVSALPGEGKSTTSINLAITLADAGQRVAVVDGDLRRPSVSRYLGLEGSVGLTTVLIGKVALEDAVQPWGTENLHVLPSGQIPPNPSELLGSAQMVRTIEQLTQAYDVVLIDSAPLLPVTDGAILAKMTGGAILVVGAGVAHKAHVTEAAGALRTVDADLVGTVLNRSEVSERSTYRYRYYSSDEDVSPAGAQHGARDAGKRTHRPGNRPGGERRWPPVFSGR